MLRKAPDAKCAQFSACRWPRRQEERSRSSVLEHSEEYNRERDPAAVIATDSLQKQHQLKPQIRNEETGTERPSYCDLWDSNEIRLLYLQPRSSGDKIACTIQNVSFGPLRLLNGTPSDNALSYEALSYVWEPQNILKTIVVNDEDVNVRENLWFALHHLRWESKIRVLWIDALCINQQNIHERNHQVAQMGKVYHQAERVIVWLGAPDSDSKFAFERLSSFNWITLVRPSSDPTRTELGDQDFTTVYSVVTRGYWKRLWIIQEFLSARDILLQSGGDTCNEYSFSKFLRVLGDIPKQSRDKDVEMRGAIVHSILNTTAARLFQQRNTPGIALLSFRPEADPEPLFHLYLAYKGSECEDQRDKIFGLHSLGTPCCKEAVPVNYSLTWPLILGKLVRHQIVRHHFVPACIRSESKVRRVQKYSTFYRQVEGGASVSYLADLGSELTNSSLNFEESFIWWADMLMRSSSNTVGLGLGAWLRCYARGRVCFISPPLNLHFDQTWPAFPELTLMVKSQINFISTLCDHSEVHHPHVTTELDLVRFCVRGTWFDHSGDLKNPRGSYVDTSKLDTAYWGNNISISKYGPEGYDLVRNFRQLLYNAHKACPKSDYVLAFEENGLIFFAPKDTEIGSVVCQFQGSDVLLLIQRNSCNETVHRAVNFLASHFSVAADVCGETMSFDKAESHALDFYALADAIYDLCRVSKTPNGEHNILKTQS